MSTDGVHEKEISKAVYGSMRDALYGSEAYKKKRDALYRRVANIAFKAAALLFILYFALCLFIEMIK